MTSLLIITDPSGSKVAVLRGQEGWELPRIAGSRQHPYWHDGDGRLSTLGTPTGLVPLHEGSIKNAPETRYVACATRQPTLASSLTALNWISVHDGAHVLDDQTSRDALATWHHRVLNAASPFDGLSPNFQYDDGVFRAMGRLSGGPVTRLRYRRLGRYYRTALASCRALRGVVRTDGIVDPRRAAVAASLYRLCAAHFPRLLHVDACLGFTIESPCGGLPLVTRDAPGAIVGDVLARIHQDAAGDAVLRHVLTSRIVTPAQLRAVAHRVVDRYPAAFAPSAKSRVNGAIDRALDGVWRDSRHTWIHGDLQPENILVDRTSGGVGLIDLEQSCWGPGVLALWRLTNELQQRLDAAPVATELWKAYYRASQHQWRSSSLETLRRDVEIAGALFQVLIQSERDSRRRLEADDVTPEWGCCSEEALRRAGARLARLVASG